MIEYVILYVIVSLLIIGSVVQSSRGSKVPLAQCRVNVGQFDSVSSEAMFVRSRRLLLINTVNVGQFESVSSRDTGRDGSY